MDFTAPDLIAALAACRASKLISDRATAHNFTWDQRISAERVAAFEASVTFLVAPTPPGLRNAYRSYFSEHVEWDPEEPAGHTFQSVNDDAGLLHLPEKRIRLVRMVKIKPTLDTAGFTADQLGRALELQRHAAANDSSDEVANARRTLSKFVDIWNEFNRRPPAFVGLADDVEKELEAPDWPDQLRRRFGIGHLTVPKGANPIPVMLLTYTVGDVLKAAKAHCRAEMVFRVPTTLEANLYDYFFPAPTAFPYGRTVHLDGDQAVRRLASEIVHLPVDIDMAHIDRIGEIRETAPVPPLGSLRDHHLDALRIDSECEDFGEYMDRDAA